MTNAKKEENKDLASKGSGNTKSEAIAHTSTDEQSSKDPVASATAQISEEEKAELKAAMKKEVEAELHKELHDKLVGTGRVVNGLTVIPADNAGVEERLKNPLVKNVLYVCKNGFKDGTDSALVEIKTSEQEKDELAEKALRARSGYVNDAEIAKQISALAK